MKKDRLEARERAKMSEELTELRNIKKLLVLLLMKSKVDQDKTAKVLGLKDQSAVSHMLNPKSKKSAKKVRKRA